MKNKRLLRASLESRIEEIAATVEPVVVAPLEGEVVPAEVGEQSVIVVDSADLELEAVQRAQQETADTVDAIDQMAAAAAQLDDVRSNIAATLPNGGLSQGEAVAYAAATDAIVGDMGVTEVIPAMENFGGSMSRLDATQESLKSVSEVIKRVVARGIELLEALLERIGKLAVRIFDYLVGDKNRMATYEKILGYSDKSRRVTFKVAKDVAELLGLGSNGMYDGGPVNKLLSVLTQTATAAITSSTVNSHTLVEGKASDLKTIIAGSTTKAGNVIKSEKLNGVQISETLPSGEADFDSYDIEVESPEYGDGTVEVTMSGAALGALMSTLKQMDEGALKKLSDTSKGVKVGASVIAWFTNKFGEEEAAAHISAWRHLVVTRAGVAPQVLGVVSRIVQGSMSVLSKGTAQLTSQEAPKGLPNKA